MPIQRVPRYQLLLSELVKNSEESHPDFEDLSKALALVKNVSSWVFRSDLDF